jgi:glycosyltransferase involved in cell wall biosynthesis
LAPPGTHFIPHLSPELYASALKAARVFVTSAWAAATAPHAIEAGLAGCSLVLSERIKEKEPFGAEATFYPPNNFKSLREALAKAHRNYSADAPKRARLRERLAAQCSWSQTVEHTLAVYRTVIAQRAPLPAEPVPEMVEQLA